jgi:hypothetical protein
MKNNLKHLERQLAEMNQYLSPPHPRGVLWMDVIDQNKREGLALDERIVEDYYEDADGEEVILVERITSDPSDKGKDFAHGSWDRRYLDAINRHPPIIDRIVVRKKRRRLD